MWSGSWGVYPNTGVSMPSKNGNIDEMVSDDEFSVAIKRYVDMGANMVGACCGSTPETIGQIKKTLKHGSIWYSILDEKKMYCPEQGDTKTANWYNYLIIHD